MRHATARRSKACSSATSASKKSSNSWIFRRIHLKEWVLFLRFLNIRVVRKWYRRFSYSLKMASKHPKVVPQKSGTEVAPKWYRIWRYLAQNTRKPIKVVLSKSGTNLWVQYSIRLVNINRSSLKILHSSLKRGWLKVWTTFDQLFMVRKRKGMGKRHLNERKWMVIKTCTVKVTGLGWGCSILWSQQGNNTLKQKR